METVANEPVESNLINEEHSRIKESTLDDRSSTTQPNDTMGDNDDATTTTLETTTEMHNEPAKIPDESHSTSNIVLGDVSLTEEVVLKVQELVLDEICAQDPAEEEEEEKSAEPQMMNQPVASTAGYNREKTSEYKIKTIKWNDGSVPIITQNENGPCPLIAIVNVLLLNSKKNPFGSKQVVNSEDLVSYLGDVILINAPQSYASESAQLNYEQNMADAISIFPKLQTGLDVNVKFTGVNDFEYTPECIIFDLLNIPLYHGWLVDPQAKDVEKAVGKLSYNQLVEKIITNKSSLEPDTVTEALVAESFLEGSASQLTHYGLLELNGMMKSGEMAVLFRNNHFSTIYKHKNELFQLVTDQGFLHESNVVWETLSNIDGDGQFVDTAFVTVPPKPTPSGSVPPLVDPVNPEEQIKQDFLVALSLQKEESREEEIAANWEEYKTKELGITSEITDEELAWKLHEDEQKHAQAESESRRAAAAHNANESLPKQQSTDSNPGQPSKKKSDCVIL